MSNPFLDRRKAQLQREGKEDLAQNLERAAMEAPPLPPPPFESFEAEEEGGEVVDAEGADTSFVDMLEASESDSRSAIDVVAFVKHTLDSFDFGASSATIATAEREVARMTPRERQRALRVATEQGIKMKPVYYSKLAERAHADLEVFYKEMVRKVGELERVFMRYAGGRRVDSSPDDVLRVGSMTHAELNIALDEVSDEDVRNRKSFYQALLDRLIKEI